MHILRDTDAPDLRLRIDETLARARSDRRYLGESADFPAWILTTGGPAAVTIEAINLRSNGEAVGVYCRLHEPRLAYPAGFLMDAGTEDLMACSPSEAPRLRVMGTDESPEATRITGWVSKYGAESAHRLGIGASWLASRGLSIDTDSGHIVADKAVHVVGLLHGPGDTTWVVPMAAHPWVRLPATRLSPDEMTMLSAQPGFEKLTQFTLVDELHELAHRHWMMHRRDYEVEDGLAPHWRQEDVKACAPLCAKFGIDVEAFVPAVAHYESLRPKPAARREPFRV